MDGNYDLLNKESFYNSIYKWQQKYNRTFFKSVKRKVTNITVQYIINIDQSENIQMKVNSGIVSVHWTYL